MREVKEREILTFDKKYIPSYFLYYIPYQESFQNHTKFFLHPYALVRSLLWQMIWRKSQMKWQTFQSDLLMS